MWLIQIEGGLAAGDLRKADTIETELKINDLVQKLSTEKKIRTKLEKAIKKVRGEDQAGETKAGMITKVFQTLPETSIWCFGKDRHDR